MQMTTQNVYYSPNSSLTLFMNMGNMLPKIILKRVQSSVTISAIRTFRSGRLVAYLLHDYLSQPYYCCQLTTQLDLWA